jgi:CheY-like chemotaxis protein
VAQGLLAFYDLNVETCTSGHETVEKIKQGKIYDIIFLDHMMPNMDGIETMQALRKLNYTRPIVVLTANVSDEIEKEYLDIGFDSFLAKPIMTEQMHSLLVEYVQSKHPGVPESTEEIAPNFSDNNHVLDRLRLDFAVSQRTTLQEIKAAISAGDLKIAHLLAHTLKGLAMLIQEHAMSQIAHDIEVALASGIIPDDNKLDLLETELNRILKSVPLPAAANKEDIFALLENLKPLLERRSNECKNMIGELKTIPEAAILVHQIEKLKFKNALESLNSLHAILLSS